MPEISRPARISRPGIESAGFKCGVVLVFLRFSAFPEVIASITGVKTHVIYLFGPIAVLAVIVSGSLRRVFREKTSKFWVLFVVWMILAVPFSSWKGDSFTRVVDYLKADFVLLLTTAGLAQKWTDCRKVMYAVAAAAIFNMATAYFFQAGGSRLSFDVAGTIGNSDDLAAHLLIVLPFLLFIALRSRTCLLCRLLAILAIAVGIFQIFKTSTRGALVALLVTTVLLFIRGSLRQKFAVAASAVLAFILLTILLPAANWQRLTSFSRGADHSEEAMQSSDERQYLLKQSIIYTLEHPIFGVGPGQFVNYLGKNTTEPGRHGMWLNAHNSYTEISSECGIPALIFYLAAATSTFGLLAKIRKKAMGPYRQEILTAAYCLNMALVAYSTAALFVNFGYRPEIIGISGLVLAMWFVVKRKAFVSAYDNASLAQLASNLQLKESPV
jgi:O-antigen ligase